MKIVFPDSGYKFSRFRDDLTHLISQPDYKLIRPCPGCHIPCECCGSTSCACSCGHECVEAPAQMSSDPERFPIEPGIAPLVFEFYALRSCHPGWSCEGHEHEIRGLIRPPQLWFFTTSAIYPRLIGEYAHNLFMKKKLNSLWEISLGFAPSESPYTSFTFKPCLSGEENITLPVMQQDALTLADGFARNIKAMAVDYLERL